jgi:hypothetical protein
MIEKVTMTEEQYKEALIFHLSEGRKSYFLGNEAIMNMINANLKPSIELAKQSGLIK